MNDQPLRLLVIGAHPADIFDQSGGTMAHHAARGGYTNDVFIDITDVIDKKFAAMECLVSQGYAGDYNRKRIETSDGAFGMSGGCSYCEGFISLHSQTYYHLPLSEYSLKRARSSDHEIMAAYSWRYDPPAR